MRLIYLSVCLLIAIMVFSFCRDNKSKTTDIYLRDSKDSLKTKSKDSLLVIWNKGLRTGELINRIINNFGVKEYSTPSDSILILFGKPNKESKSVDSEHDTITYLIYYTAGSTDSDMCYLDLMIIRGKYIGLTGITCE
jgi:hypothetical protein